MSEPKPTEPQPTVAESEDNEAWRLALLLNHELTRAKDKLEKALLDARSLQALRRSVRQVHIDLVATERVVARYFEDTQGNDEEGGQGCA
jgi:hypothetical protein